jgi:hypothetical protein
MNDSLLSEDNQKNRKAGRPATGQNTKVIRVPNDFDRPQAIKSIYDWLPIMKTYTERARINRNNPRYDQLCKMLEELEML